MASHKGDELKRLPAIAPIEGDAASPRRVAILLLSIAAYAAVAQLLIPPSVRGGLLTLGAGGVAAAALLTAGSLARRKVPALLALAAILLCWGLAVPAAINGTDDNSAYLLIADIFYRDLADTIQPLSERRLFAVGGIYAFQAPVIHWLGAAHINLVEPALGLLLLAVVVLAVPRVSTIATLLALALLAAAPVFGSGALANTQSSFTLAAFSLALLVAAHATISQKQLRARDAAVVVAMPLVALIFRPTTAPFNLAVAGATVGFIALVAPRDLVRLALASAAALPLFAAALVSYEGVGETYLYPLLGRGTHITAAGASITATLSATELLRDIACLTATDPFFVAASAALLAGALSFDRRRSRAAFGALLAIYAGFAAIVIVATGGLASMRYVFPVSLAALLFAIVAAAAEPGPIERRLRRIDRPAVAWMLAGATIATLAAIPIVGKGAIERRLEHYRVTPAHQAELAQVAAVANAATGPHGAVLLVAISPGRFLAPMLGGRVYLMDQPGMLEPWRGVTGDYRRGLEAFMAARDIRAIVVATLRCPAEAPLPAKGWLAVMRQANARNSETLCALEGDMQRSDVGGYTVLTRR